MNMLLVILMILFCNPRIVMEIYLISIHLISLFRDFEKAFNLVDCPKIMSLYWLPCIHKNVFSNVVFFHSGKVAIQFQDFHSLHRVPCIASIIQFYEQSNMLLLKAFGTR